MFVIRQSQIEDLDEIFEIAKHLDTVNLPADKGALRSLLEISNRSFSRNIMVEDRKYVFVLEDVTQKRIVGTSMIHAQHGTRQAPHVYFQVLSDERYSSTIDRYFVHKGLRLGFNYAGPTEIGGLILLPEYRGHKQRLGRLLSFCRFLFIAIRRKEFRDEILSELLPPLEKDGTSRLWEHLGRHFTGLTYQEADRISQDNKEFIQLLFPHSVIYTSLLPKQVRDVIGKVGPKTIGVEKMLRNIGFRYAEKIDPFDGGPHFTCPTDSCLLISQAQQRTLQETTTQQEGWGIVATEGNGQFRAVITGGQNRAANWLTTPAMRKALHANVGDSVWGIVP